MLPDSRLSGANILDVNFDEALLNGEECMRTFKFAGS